MNMNKESVKTEIHKVVDILPDDLSNEVLAYLKSILDKSSHDVNLASNLSKILTEDQELLNRLECTKLPKAKTSATRLG